MIDKVNMLEQYFFENLPTIRNIGILVFVIFVIFFLFIIGHSLINSNFISIFFIRNIRKIFDFKKDNSLKEQDSDQWTKIMKRLEIEEEHSYKLAVIEAHNLLLVNLKKIVRFSDGKLQLESDMMVKKYFFDLTEVKKLFQIKNDIVDDVDYKFNRQEAEETLEKYRIMLQKLGVI